MSLVHQRFMFGPDGSLTPIDDDLRAMEVADTPPRHSADDYKGIAERLKQLGYRGWTTG